MKINIDKFDKYKDEKKKFKANTGKNILENCKSTY